MSLPWGSWLSLAGVGLGALLAAQEPAGGQEPKPKPAPGAAAPAPQPPAAKPPAEPAAPPAAPDVQALVRGLGDTSFRVRLDAEKALRALGEAALPALREAAADDRDHEVQWRARRLLRQIERDAPERLGRRDRDGAAPPPDAPRPGWPGLPEGMRDRFERLFGELERDFGADIPRARFFGDGFFRDLEAQMERAMAEAQSGGGEGRSMSLQMGPDGVKVEVKTKNDRGEVETQTYEAPDLETLQREHPDLLGPGARMFRFDGLPGFGPAPGWQRAPGLAPRWAPPPAAVEPPPGGRRLGVFVRPELPEELRLHLDLDEGLGLMVESVQDGSLAAALGLQPHDIVLRVGKAAIGSTADVQQALADLADGAEVEVEFLRKGARQTAKAPLPAAKPAAAEGGQGKPPGRLERRQAGGESIR